MSIPNRLYELLPAIYRQRDLETPSQPLEQLLQVITEQVNVVEADIDQLYKNWFIETCEDWVVPYIADLIGYQAVTEAGLPGDISTPQGQALNRILFPRREIANTIRYRRRKGTLALLELLAKDVANWPARAVEFYPLLGRTQHLNHLNLDRGRTIDLRASVPLAHLDGPFDRLGHTVELPNIQAHRDPGRYNLPNVGVFIWRLQPYSVTGTPAYCLEEVGPYCYTFSVLGNDTPLFTRPDPEPEPTHIAQPLNLPVPIDRHAFTQPDSELTSRERASEHYYGSHRSLAIWADGWGGTDAGEPIPAAQILPADLSDWHYRPAPNYVAVDPELGRIVFPPGQMPQQGVRVYYHYGFSDDIGGGEYSRPLSQTADIALYPVGQQEHFNTVNQALEQWRTDQQWKSDQGYDLTLLSLDSAETLPRVGQQLVVVANIDHAYHVRIFDRSGNQVVDQANESFLTDEILRQQLEAAFSNQANNPANNQATDSQAQRELTQRIISYLGHQPVEAVIEITDSQVYTEPFNISLGPGQRLQIRAANHVRPVIRLLDYLTSSPDSFNIHGDASSALTLDGLLIMGRGVRISGEFSHVMLRHSTLVPGWAPDANCEPLRPTEPSLELFNVTGNVQIERCILGSIQVTQDEVQTDPIPLTLTDSILDATASTLEAIGAPGCPVAHVSLRVYRSTLIGLCQVHGMPLAENSIFMGTVTVARRQVGCVRFCYVPPGSKTPRRYRCQPDLVVAAAADDDKAIEQHRVKPTFNSLRYGQPAYGQLSHLCADEIKRGADDESEMGVFHDLFQPQRQTILQTRLNEFTPAEMRAGIIYAN